MDIIVAGCGKIGEAIISNLTAEGHNITAIDKDPEVIENITNIYDIMGVCGNGSDVEILSEANVERVELFIAVSGNDESNMLSCFIARKMGAKHTIARIRNPEYNENGLDFMRQNLNLSVTVNPEALTAKELFNILKLPDAVKIENFSRKTLEMVEILLKKDSVLDGVKLSELSEKYNAKILVCAIQRGNKVYIPDGSFELQSGDRIGITAKPEEIIKFFKPLGFNKKQAKSVMILGGSKTAYYLAKILTKSGCSVKIIESDRERCQQLCDSLDKAVIINGDGAQQELLREEGIESVDAFIALTGIDETNILISLFASSIGVPTVIPKINRKELAKIATNLGLDCIISPQDVTSSIFVRYARAVKNSLGSNVETMYKVMDGNAEVLEFNVSPEFKQIDIPLKELTLKPNILITGIIRGRNTIIPNGNDVIKQGDKVIIFATDHRLQDLSDIIK